MSASASVSVSVSVDVSVRVNVSVGVSVGVNVGAPTSAVWASSFSRSWWGGSGSGLGRGVGVRVRVRVTVRTRLRVADWCAECNTHTQHSVLWVSGAKTRAHNKRGARKYTNGKQKFSKARSQNTCFTICLDTIGFTMFLKLFVGHLANFI